MLSCRISDFAHLPSIKWGHCFIYRGWGWGAWYISSGKRRKISIFGVCSDSPNQLHSSSSPSNSIPNSRSCWECEVPVLLFTKLYHSIHSLPSKAFLKTNEIMSSVQYKPVPSQLNERFYVLWPHFLFCSIQYFLCLFTVVSHFA